MRIKCFQASPENRAWCTFSSKAVQPQLRNNIPRLGIDFYYKDWGHYTWHEAVSHQWGPSEETFLCSWHQVGFCFSQKLFHCSEHWIFITDQFPCFPENVESYHGKCTESWKHFWINKFLLLFTSFFFFPSCSMCSLTVVSYKLT